MKETPGAPSPFTLSKSKGASRNLTSQFLKLKQRADPSAHTANDTETDIRIGRFGPLKPALLSALSGGNSNNFYPLNSDSNGGYSGVSSPQETEKLTQSSDYQKLGGKQQIMSTKANSSDESVSMIEYGKRFMPPLWVDIQEEIEGHIDEITQKMGELKRMQQRRLKVNFIDDDDDDNSQKSLQRSIDTLSRDITDLVRASEGKLKELMKCQPQDDSRYDEQIRANIQITLATRLKDITFKLRKREKKHFLKVQDLHGESTQQTEGKGRDAFLNDDNGAMMLDLQLDEEELQQRHRSKEIKHLVGNINDLAVLFKELSILVVEQGTILDRIDYNIEAAHKDVKQAVVHIENTVKIEKSTRAKSVLVCLLGGIMVCLVLMIFKHT